MSGRRRRFRKWSRLKSCFDKQLLSNKKFGSSVISNRSNYNEPGEVKSLEQEENSKENLL